MNQAEDTVKGMSDCLKDEIYKTFAQRENETPKAADWICMRLAEG